MKKDKKDNRQFLYDILSDYSPSGGELNIQKKIIDMMKDIDDEVICNHNYNVTHVVNPKSDMKILFCAHIDEIGLYVDEILDNGLIKLNRIGHIRPYVYISQQVKVITRDKNKENVNGIIGYLPNMNKGIEVSDLRLDIGARNKEEAEQLVSIGDYVLHASSYQLLANDRLSARALDDKISVYILREVLRRAKEKGCENGLYAAFTVGEETTGRGAKIACDTVKPDLAIVLDVSYVNDVNYLEGLHGETKLGGGPILEIGSLVNDKIDEILREIAKDKKMKIQNTVDSSNTYTDLDSIYDRCGGVVGYLVNIPLRYMHSSVEVCDMKDIEDIIELLVEFCFRINKQTSFNPFE